MARHAPIKIYCLPGIGLDERLYARLEIKNAELVHLKWAPSSTRDTMHSYAAKISAQIKADEEFYLMGVSFGGMVCVELAEILNPKKVFLISSAKHRGELPWYIGILKFIPLHQLFGERFYKWLSKSVWRLIGIRRADKDLFFDMVESPPAHYYRGAVNCVVNWKRKHALQNIFHVHGNKDYILPIRFVECDAVIEKGSHAMIAYQAGEIAGLVERELSR